MKLTMNVKVILPTNQSGVNYIDDDKMFLKDISTISEADGDAVFKAMLILIYLNLQEKDLILAKKDCQ